MGAIDPSDYKPEVVELVYQPWNIEVHPYPDGGYFARVVELPGCMTEADTAGEALDMLEEARAEWLAVAVEQGLRIPQPLASADYSGKIFVRTSPELHRRVAEQAAKQGVSMSQWVSETLALTLGVQHALAEVISPIEGPDKVDLMAALKASIDAAKDRKGKSEREAS